MIRGPTNCLAGLSVKQVTFFLSVLCFQAQLSTAKRYKRFCPDSKIETAAQPRLRRILFGNLEKRAEILVVRGARWGDLENRRETNAGE